MTRRGVNRDAPVGDGAVLPLPGVELSWFLAQLSEQSPYGFGIVDREQRYVVINSSLAAMNRLDRERHRGRTVADLLGSLPGGPEKNLVENARRHGARGRPVTITIRGGERTVAVSVHNHGRPIPGAELTHLFDPFRQGAQRRRSGGLGLGLYITREIVRAHGGEIEVVSTEAEGTTFRFELPRAPAGAAH